MDNLKLADYLEQRFLPEVQKKCKTVTLDFWLKLLRSNPPKIPSHDWVNLAAIIHGWGRTIGQDYSLAANYCMEQGGLKPII